MARTLDPQIDDSAGGSAPCGSRFGGSQSGVPDTGRSGLPVRFAVVAALVVAGGLFAAACLLWARHGATVFFDIMSAGIAACL